MVRVARCVMGLAVILVAGIFADESLAKEEGEGAKSATILFACSIQAGEAPGLLSIDSDLRPRYVLNHAGASVTCPLQIQDVHDTGLGGHIPMMEFKLLFGDCVKAVVPHAISHGYLDVRYVSSTEASASLHAVRGEQHPAKCEVDTFELERLQGAIKQWQGRGHSPEKP